MPVCVPVVVVSAPVRAFLCQCVRKKIRRARRRAAVLLWLAAEIASRSCQTMLYADKQALETDLKVSLLAIRERELNLYTSCFRNIGTMSGVFAGFAYEARPSPLPILCARPRPFAIVCAIVWMAWCHATRVERFWLTPRRSRLCRDAASPRTSSRPTRPRRCARPTSSSQPSRWTSTVSRRPHHPRPSTPPSPIDPPPLKALSAPLRALSRPLTPSAPVAALFAATVCAALGPGLALRGPDGSMERAVEGGYAAEMQPR